MATYKTDDYARWFDGLRDRRAKARIATRIIRLENGNPGDVRPIGKGASEMRLTYGPGYRIYYLQEGDAIVLLFGGDKSSQAADIAHALSLLED